jgi:hypothetical protein
MLSRVVRSNLLEPVLALTSQQKMGFAAAVSDPIQKLFLDKLREYSTKSGKTADGLVDADATVKATLADDMMRVKRSFGVADGEETKLNSNFKDSEFVLDSIHMKDWK